MMLSFIIIGKNEGENIIRCIKSVLKCVHSNQIPSFEIIYVDSNSADNSIQNIIKFPNIKIYKIVEEKINSAMARNVGANQSKGDICFFIDGDMEIESFFIRNVLTKKVKLRYPFISGDLVNIYIDDLSSERYYNLKRDVFKPVVGGIFIIKKELWDQFGGMNTKFKYNEDLDFGLRLSKNGYRLLRKKEVIAKHYTVSYNSIKRMYRDPLSGSLFFRSVLFRKHIFVKNINILAFLFKKEISFFILIISFIIGYFNFLLAIFFYFLVLLLLLIFKNKSFLKAIVRLPYYIVKDIIFICTLFLFFPKERKNIDFIRIK